MITVDEARALVRARAQPVGGTEAVPLAAALGRVLSGPVRADRFDPPFDRAMMDGYAVRAEETAHGPRRLEVVGRVAAGDTELPSVGAGQAAWVNTGAPLPPGADAVVPVEDTRDDVTVLASVPRGAHVLPKGALARPGEEVAAGRLTPERIAICAAVGADPVSVRRRLRVAVLSTGSELQEDPGVFGIRNSNGPMLRAPLADHDVLDLGAVRDDVAALDERLARGLAEADVLVTSGGVSQGELDLVRPRLEAHGVEIVLHRVQLQPGKPFLFGAHGPRGAVFGLPGNPVSALVCADLFLLPYLAARAGRDFDDALLGTRGTLQASVASSPKRRRVLPCVYRDGEVAPLPWRSSADLYTMSHANAYFVVELGHDVPAGSQVDCLVPERFAARCLGR